MSTKSGRCVTWMALGFLAAAGIGICARAADAAVGKVLWTVNIPDAAKCQTISAGTRSGTAVAVVPGGKLNFPKFPSLLVTSCVEEVLVQPNQAGSRWRSVPTRSTSLVAAWWGTCLRSTRSTSARSRRTPSPTGRPPRCSPARRGRPAKGSRGTSPARLSMRAPPEYYRMSSISPSLAPTLPRPPLPRAAQAR